ncbi:MAG: 2Fe-2S iron-sulfur cluster-binding protein [Thermoplasmata archaeon]|nr:2Fe-2S iron-sulfur cluster-binding protein [Thermoplasmata archaeon]
MDTAPPREYTVNGAGLRSAPAVPLARALSRRHPPLLQRSIRYHRPRAPFCGVGFCTGCLVRVNGIPNVRACTYEPRSGDRIRTENAWPSSRFDLLGLLDVIFPHGIDTLHGFRRPRMVVPWYHRVVRQLAGYGKLPTPGPAATPPPGELVDRPVVIVGAGRTGRWVGEQLNARGVRALLLDRRAPTQPEPALEIRSRTTVAFLPPPAGTTGRRFRLVATQPGSSALMVRAESVVVASGGYDTSLLFPGNDRPGVLTADGTLALSGDHGAPPFTHAVVVGGGQRAAAMLDRFGEAVDAVVAPGAIEPQVTARATNLGVPLYPRTIIARANGHRRVRSVLLASRGRGASFEVPVDAVVLAHRRLPNNQLLFQAGARMSWRSIPGGYYPELDPAGRTSVPGLFAYGTVAGGAGAPADASTLAECVVTNAGPWPDPSPSIVEEMPNELDGYYREFLDRPRGRGKTIACACEDVLLEEVEEASRAGFRGIEVVKRYTSLGTGLCQGRYCLPDALLLLAILEGRTPPEVGYIRQRPPVVPVTLGALAELPEPAPESAA